MGTEPVWTNRHQFIKDRVTVLWLRVSVQGRIADPVVVLVGVSLYGLAGPVCAAHVYHDKALSFCDTLSQTAKAFMSNLQQGRSPDSLAGHVDGAGGLLEATV